MKKWYMILNARGLAVQEGKHILAILVPAAANAVKHFHSS